MVYSWFLPILKSLITCLYPCSLPRLLPRSFPNDWRPTLEIWKPRQLLVSLHISWHIFLTSSLLCLPQMPELPAVSVSYCQLFAWLNLTVDLRKCAHLTAYTSSPAYASGPAPLWVGLLPSPIPSCEPVLMEVTDMLYQITILMSSHLLICCKFQWSIISF